MRACILLAVLALTGCTSDLVQENTAFRRLVDGFSSEQQCIADGNFNVCYQTLTLCTNGKVTMDLVNRPTSGEYEIAGNTAIASFIDMRVEFDLDARTSPQLPGTNPWMKVEPLVYDCN